MSYLAEGSPQTDGPRRRRGGGGGGEGPAAQCSAVDQLPLLTMAGFHPLPLTSPPLPPPPDQLSQALLSGTAQLLVFEERVLRHHHHACRALAFNTTLDAAHNRTNSFDGTFNIGCIYAVKCYIIKGSCLFINQPPLAHPKMVSRKMVRMCV